MFQRLIISTVVCSVFFFVPVISAEDQSNEEKAPESAQEENAEAADTEEKDVSDDSSSEKEEDVSDECRMMEEVCSDARDFQATFNKMPEKEQKEMRAVLNTLIKHCKRAEKLCEESKSGE